MGACGFSTVTYVDDVDQAFRRAVSDAAHDRGHGGYSGTIAEKHDYVVVDRNLVDVDRARTVADDLIESEDPRVNDKWGPAGAIRCAETEVVERRTVDVTVTVPLDPDTIPEEWQVHNALATAATAKVAAKLAKGERASHARVDRDTVSASTRRDAGRTAGKSTTVYDLRVEGTRPRGDYRLRGHASVAAARAEAERICDDHADAAMRVTVSGRVVRVDGDNADAALVVVANAPRKATATVTVHVDKVRRTGRSGWLFFGWASS